MNDNPAQAVVIRSPVRPQKNYLNYREALRYDFWYSCAYCTITEIEAWAIGFEIEHYYPKKTAPKLINSYDNLMWSCEHCNRYKSDYHPNEKDMECGNFVLRPDKDDPREHLEMKGFKLIEKTHAGKFNIELLELNRKALIRLREIRKRFYDSNEYLASGIHGLRRLRLDSLNPKNRFNFNKIKKRVFEQKGILEESFSKVIRELAKSPFLDENSEKGDRLKVRKKFLKEQYAITHEYESQ